MSERGNPVEPTRVDPQAWVPTPPTASATSSEWDVRLYSDVEVQFEGAPTTPYQPQRRLGATWVNCMAYGADNLPVATITASGIYSFDGNCYLRFLVGAGATLTRRAAS